MSATYIDAGAVLLQGYPAALVTIALIYARDRNVFTILKQRDQAQLAELIALIERAAKSWHASVSADGHSDMGLADTEVQGRWHERLTTKEAAELLGVDERQARRLAARGFGQKVAARWLLDRELVLAERERRQIA